MRRKIKIKNAYFIKLPLIAEKERGSLCFGEVKKAIPFTIKRFFYIFNVPKGKSRGDHANKKTDQVLLCLKGKVKIELDDGTNRDKLILTKPNFGIFVGKMIWRRMIFLEENTILLVLASDYYNKNDYIRNYEDFKKYFKKR